jgi:2-C-methyl-D-erythritol 4-phosphate cytidylyltransferase
MLKRTMIIVAGGSGSRMGTNVPKQFLLLKGVPILMHTLRNLHKADGTMTLILVLPSDHIEAWESHCETLEFSVPHITVAGGPTRFRSVQNGLAAVKNSDFIGIHDGVRPFVSKTVVENCFISAAQHGAAIPAIPIANSLREVRNGANVAVDRSAFRSVQTPQCFRTSIIKDAYAKAPHDLFTDDASVVESAGNKIALVEGNPENIKITTPMDMKLAELLIS